MIIPKLHYITQGQSPKEHIENIQKACSSGAELVQLHLKNISEKNILKLATEAREITSHFQTRLIINDYYKIAKSIKADGVHLGPTDACPKEVRKHLYTWQIIGGTASTLQECQTLIAKNVDYISLGPFKTSKTKETTNPELELEAYKTILDTLNTQIPIISIGGITTDDVKTILETGIVGIAVSEAITLNFNNIKTFNNLLKASSTEEKRYSFK